MDLFPSSSPNTCPKRLGRDRPSSPVMSPVPDLLPARLPRLSALGHLVTQGRPCPPPPCARPFRHPSRVAATSVRTCRQDSHAARPRLRALLPLATPQPRALPSLREPGTPLPSPKTASRTSARRIESPSSRPHAAPSSAAKFNGVLSIIAARRHDKTLHVSWTAPLSVQRLLQVSSWQRVTETRNNSGSQLS